MRLIGRYAVHSELASGGMATVHLARLRGQAGFTRTVAIKRLHASFAKDPEFVSMFLDEARLAARIRHANVVPVLDVEAADGELFLVMEYVHGETLGKLIRAQAGPLPAALAGRVAADMLYGLDAAHEAHDERGQPLHIVHRDVSPQNVLVGVDGIGRVTDFGVAKAVNRIQTTHEGQLKGKLSYMAPEQLEEAPVDRRTDVYAASVVLWESLTGRRLHTSQDPGATIRRILEGKPYPPSRLVADVPAELDAIVLQGMARDPDRRFSTAQEMAVALEQALRLDPAPKVSAWVRANAKDSLAERAALVASLEASDPESSGGREQGAAVAVELARLATKSLADIGQPTRPILPNDGGATAGTEARGTLTLDTHKTESSRRRVRLAALVGAGALLVLGLFTIFASRDAEKSEERAAASPSAGIEAARAESPAASFSARPTPEPAADAEASAVPSASARAAKKPPATAKTGPGAPPPAPTKPKSPFGALTRE